MIQEPLEVVDANGAVEIMSDCEVVEAHEGRSQPGGARSIDTAGER